MVKRYQAGDPEPVFPHWAMIALAVTFGLLLGLLHPGCVKPAHASSLDCEGIHDADQRNLCRAVARGDRSFCEFIKDNDLRHQCRARVK
jgi:hypothetical protein